MASDLFDRPDTILSQDGDFNRLASSKAGWIDILSLAKSLSSGSTQGRVVLNHQDGRKKRESGIEILNEN